MASHDPLLSVYGLKRDYDSPAGRLSVLKDVRLDLQAGSMTILVGRSGSGKSTLLHLLAGLDSPTGGKILFEGKDLTAMKEKELARLRNERIGFVFQFYHLLPELTLYENVLLPTLIRGRRDDEWAGEILRKVGLWERRDHFPSELSGGEQQRGAVARALVNRPALVFCDEPTGNLDRESAEAIFALMEELNRREGQTFLIVSHDEGLAWRYQNVFRLTDGVLIRRETSGLKTGTLK